MNARKAEVSRKTSETEVRVRLSLDGKGESVINTRIGFLDHMLASFAVHGRFNLEVQAKGDLHVDNHHTVEDVGIVLGKAIGKALEERHGIRRYGTSILPMDETLGMVSLDLSDRSLCQFDTPLTGKIGTFDAELIEEFFIAISRGGAFTLHAKILAGRNQHHMAEALFKAFGRALDAATQIDPKIEGAPSSKGTLI
jgi:imidazoleglycerol-phosphate dehydratase